MKKVQEKNLKEKESLRSLYAKAKFRLRDIRFDENSPALLRKKEEANALLKNITQDPKA